MNLGVILEIYGNQIFGEDPDHPLDPGIFNRLFIMALVSNIGGVGPVGPWHRYAHVLLFVNILHWKRIVQQITLLLMVRAKIQKPRTRVSDHSPNLITTIAQTTGQTNYLCRIRPKGINE